MDDETWEITDGRYEDVRDLLHLEDPLEAVSFGSYEGFEGNALGCVPPADENAGGDAEPAYAVYTFSYTREDDVVIDLIEYNECRRLTDDAIPEISQRSVGEAYDDAAPPVQALLASVTMPDEDPEDEPERTSGTEGTSRTTTAA